MVKRSILEVDKLDERPNHPILGKSVGVGGFDLLLRVRAFHIGHVVKEDEQIGGSENGLIKTNTGEDLGIGTTRDTDTAL